VLADGETGPGVDRPLRLLVVEDEPAMRMLCRFNLEVAGFVVVEAGGGLEALEKAAGDDFDVVLLDVMLPDLSGFQVAERLRDDERTRELPIMFISARTAPADRRQGRDSGAIDYLHKPFDPVALPDRVRSNLRELREGGRERLRRTRFGDLDR
jgi:DNA-binding response OmpR family regulator